MPKLFRSLSKAQRAKLAEASVLAESHDQKEETRWISVSAHPSANHQIGYSFKGNHF